MTAGAAATAVIVLGLARTPRVGTPVAPQSAASRAADVAELPIDSGATLSRYCMGCHNPSAPAPLGPNLAAAAGRLSREQMIAVVTEGQGAMPSFGYRWSPAQIRAVVAYLRAPKSVR